MIVGFGNMSLKLLFPFLMAIFYCVERYSINNFIEENKKREDFNSSKEVQFAVSLNIIMFSAEFTSFIPLLYEHYFAGKSSKNTHKHLTKITRKKFSWKLLLFIILISIFDFLQGILLFKIRFDSKKYSPILFTKILVIIIIMIISMYILNYSYHRHHILGISIIGIGSIIFIVCELCSCKFGIISYDFCEGNNSWISVEIILCWLFTFDVSFLTAFQETCEKKFMEEYFYSPFLILTIEGVFGLVISSIPFGYFWFKGQFIFGDIAGPGYLALSYISLFFFNLSRVLTNYYYSPCHRSIADSFGVFFYWAIPVFIEERGKGNKAHTIISIISFFIILVGVIIFNEIIELHFWDCSKNTIRMIKEREIEEQKDYNKIDFVNNNNANNNP